MKMTIRFGVLVAAALLGASAQAQYKCSVNGKTTYSDVPCAAPADTRYVGRADDSVSQRSRIEAAELRAKEARQRGAIERQENVQYEVRQRAVQQQLAIEQANARAAETGRQRRCANLQYAINSNQRGVARYQDFGWQRSLTQQENELKQNREAFDRECR